MDVVGGRVVPVVDVGMSPALLWDESCVSADGAALACPLCGGANLHLDMVRFAAPADMYTPVMGVDIDAGAGLVTVAGVEAMRLHGGVNRGPMLAVGYWCEAGCRGRIELRGHKGHVFLSLREEPGGLPEDVVQCVPADGAAAVADVAGAPPPF